MTAAHHGEIRGKILLPFQILIFSYYIFYNVQVWQKVFTKVKSAVIAMSLNFSLPVISEDPKKLSEFCLHLAYKSIVNCDWTASTYYQNL